MGFRAGHWSWREKPPFFLEWRPEWQIFTVEENHLYLSDSYTLSDPQLLEPQGPGQDETKNWKLLRDVKNTESIPLTSVGLNLSFLCWKVFHLYKQICCPHKRNIKFSKSIILNKFYTGHLCCHQNTKSFVWEKTVKLRELQLELVIQLFFRIPNGFITCRHHVLRCECGRESGPLQGMSTTLMV